MKSLNWDKILSFACGIASLCMLASFFYANRFFADSYNVVGLHRIDDILFHVNLFNMRQNLAAGDFDSFFANTGFAYGNIYWQIVNLVTAPFEFLGFNSWAITMSRDISVVFCALSLLAIYKISRSRGHSQGLALLLPTFLLFTYGVAVSMCFHNHFVIVAFFLWSLYFLSLPPARHLTVLACFFMGISMAVKITGLFGLPIFFLFLNRQSTPAKLFSRAVLLRNLKCFCAVMISALFFYCPAVLLVPFGNRLFFTEGWSSLRFILIDQPRLQPPVHISLFKILGENFVHIYFHWALAILSMAIATVILVKYRKNSIDNLLLPLTTLLSGFLILLMALTSNRDAFFMRFYVMPLAFCFGWALIDGAHRFKAKWALAAIMILSIYCERQFLFSEVFRLKKESQSTEFQKQLDRFEKLREIPLHETDVVQMEMSLVFPFRDLKRYRDVYYMYDGHITPDQRTNVYIFSNKVPASPGEGELVKEGKAPYRNLYDDGEIRVVRRMENKGSGTEN